MKEGKHLSEVLQTEQTQYQRGRLNLITAQTGQGKTTAAIHTIPQQLGINPRRCLVLIDTTMGEEEKVAIGDCQEWGEIQEKPYIMTYQKFGYLIQNQVIHEGLFDYIVCDEIHNLIKYVRIDEANIVKRNPESTYEVICLILARESISYIAIDALLRWCESFGVWLFGLTATPDTLDKWYRLKKYINEIQVKEQLIAYEVFQKYEYGDVHALLQANPETKRLIFAPTVELGEKFAREISETTNRKVVTIWSKNNSGPQSLSQEQLQTIGYLQYNHCYPDNVDDIIATEAYSTGWNLVDDNVQIVIVHSGNKDIQIQFPGRKRGDWQIQYNYNSKLKDNEKRVERRRRARARIANTEWIIPDIFLNRKLGKEDKEELIKILNYPKKWTSLKRDLGKNYNIQQVGTGKNYGHTITLKNGNLER